jgi:hypothetical protein
MKQTLTLHNPQQAHQAIAAAWLHIKAHLMAGTRLVLEVRDETRRTAQNNLLHSSFSDIAKQVEWCGKRMSINVWKRLCTAAWLRELGESPEMVPALDGKGFDVIFERTSTLTVKQCASLTDWVHAFGDEHGVNWSPASLGRDWAGVDMETGEIL